MLVYPLIKEIMIMTIKGAILKWTQARRTIRELQALTNRDLADIGIARADINTVVRSIN